MRNTMSLATTMTAEQFFELPDIPGKQFEPHDGEMVEGPISGVLQGFIVGTVYRLLATVANQIGG
jgi:hypothetical protein